jgi:hypothetical protein
MSAAWIFSLIQLILKLLNLWDQFSNWMQVERQIENKEKEKRRNEAIDKSKTAETDEDIWNAQDGIVDNLP